AGALVDDDALELSLAPDLKNHRRLLAGQRVAVPPLLDLPVDRGDVPRVREVRDVERERADALRRAAGLAERRRGGCGRRGRGGRRRGGGRGRARARDGRQLLVARPRQSRRAGRQALVREARWQVPRGEIACRQVTRGLAPWQI